MPAITPDCHSARVRVSTITRKRKPWLREAAPAVTGLAVLSIGAAIVPGFLGVGHSSPPAKHQHSSLHSVSIEWPAQGQAAVAVAGLGHRASPAAAPVPIASVAKVMTAYVVLHRYPMTNGSDGFTMTLGNADVELADSDKSDGQSYVAVQAGEALTEREALEALLLPSANNIAIALAYRVDGSISAFVSDMNATARRLGMTHTTYTDPSGFDSSTVSTAADQVRLARAAMQNSVFAQIVGMHSAVLPVAGPITTTDTLLDRDGFVGIKTGSDDAAGGCFMFESVRRANAHTWRIYGVVLGQSGGPLIDAALNSADQLVNNIGPQLR
jgi:D-alanyl-D-alanine carboxypeptidase (penicillin-binding protein 5/6)